MRPMKNTSLAQAISGKGLRDKAFYLDKWPAELKRKEQAGSDWEDDGTMI